MCCFNHYWLRYSLNFYRITLFANHIIAPLISSTRLRLHPLNTGSWCMAFFICFNDCPKYWAEMYYIISGMICSSEDCMFQFIWWLHSFGDLTHWKVLYHIWCREKDIKVSDILLPVWNYFLMIYRSSLWRPSFQS